MEYRDQIVEELNRLLNERATFQRFDGDYVSLYSLEEKVERLRWNLAMRRYGLL